jgi:hypothetical protein
MIARSYPHWEVNVERHISRTGAFTRMAPAGRRPTCGPRGQSPGYPDRMETWTTRELPVLRALVEKFEDPDTWMVRIEELPAATGLTISEIRQALRALDTAFPPYLTGSGAEELSYPLIISEVTERARRAVGHWPASDSAVDVMVAALQEAAESEPDESKRRGLRDFIAGTGKEILMRVFTQVGSQEITQHIPHH